jgi:predicted cation transporter
MSLPRDTLLFSIVVMLWAVQIEASGYGSSGGIVIASLIIGVLGLAGSIISSIISANRASESEAIE